MSLIDALIVGIVLCLMEARNCSKRAQIWDAIAEVEARKQSIKGQPHILGGRE